MTTTTKTDQHVIIATTGSGRRVRSAAAWDWKSAIDYWYELDNARRDGRAPHVSFFEVRSLDEPGVEELPVDARPFLTVTTPRGFKSQEDAARVAWKQRYPLRYQGQGGWFYFGNGKTAAQGLASLAPLAAKHTLIIQAPGNGRWYVTELATPSN